ncbi:MAG: response regulator transcription factor [Bacteroidales bacterium]|nr:response regulator transcription factor [Bacteroidales bacterium]MBN2758197.1 response regulator transcription factor [Bacteroidales bacterium]
MINCIAIDDEPLALQQIEAYIKQTPFLNFIDKFDNAFDSMQIISKGKIDLMFVDINMPDISGLDFVKSLEKKPLIIFTTAYSEFAYEGFKADAIDYLLKPIDFSSFLKSANKALKNFNFTDIAENNLKTDDKYLFIKSDYKIIRINFDEIKYIEGMREYVRIYLLNSKPLMPLLSMKMLENKLPKKQFMRVHRSYIVNLKHINIVERNRIIFDNDVYIPISEQYKVQFQNYIDKHFLK